MPIQVCAYNRTTSKVDRFLANEAKGTKVVGAHSVEELCAKLKKPRRVMLLVKAGEVVDKFIDQLLPYLEKGDIIIDGGNSQYDDSIRRHKDLGEKGLLFVGSGKFMPISTALEPNTNLRIYLVQMGNHVVWLSDVVKSSMVW